ncbi:hypothetical protein [Embleya sp. NBC_00896]|uniref:hypothetical protein n=1 Tax=Embleya sp. NBC_00896 TaxID=2975961 RepID=UPI002F90D18D|nr:hypothetical protein OG928_34230 [Embleya sp. NBC_00896]
MNEFTLSPEQQALLPGPQDVDFYRRHGYWISPQIVPEEVLDAAERGMRRFYARDYDAEVPGTLDFGPGQEEGLRKHDYTSQRVGELAQLLAYPLIGASAAVLAGAAGVRMGHPVRSRSVHHLPPCRDVPGSVPSARTGGQSVARCPRLRFAGHGRVRWPATSPTPAAVARVRGRLPPGNP